MTKAGPVKLATINGAIGERVSLGWKPRDVRQRVSKERRSGPENWLKVYGEVRCSEGTWSFVDEALTEAEACELVEFLSVRPWTGQRQLTFMEPCLAFCTRGELAGKLNLEIRFRAEVSPPWIWNDPEQMWEVGYSLGLFVRDDELTRFAAELRGMQEIGKDDRVV